MAHTNQKQAVDVDLPLAWTVVDMLDATGGKLVCGQPEDQFAGVAIDSRNIGVDQAFLAIKGQTHDGHVFVDEVVKKGVKGLIVNERYCQRIDSESFKKMVVDCISVVDTTKALGNLAAFNRQRTGIGVVAITGSNGKTSTRRMVTGILAQKFKTLAPEGNFNNEIGLPLTLLRLTAQHEWAALELGMNHFGEIDYLGAICTPDIGVITNVGPAHLEGVGSLEGVLKAKSELLGRIKEDGTAVLNADDDMLKRLAKEAPVATLMFGENPGADIRACDVQETEKGSLFKMVLPAGDIMVALNTPGRFMVQNALAAAAVGHLLGLSLTEIKAGLESFNPIPGRMGILQTLNGIFVIDDTYNANPGSMQAAVKALKGMGRNGRTIMVLGDMLELGPKANKWHRKIGAFCAEVGIDRLYITGRHAEAVACGATEAGLAGENVKTGTKDELEIMLAKNLVPGDWVLVKGSRGMEMESIVARLTSAGN